MATKIWSYSHIPDTVLWQHSIW